MRPGAMSPTRRRNGLAARRAALAVPALAALALAACGPRNYVNTNDELRREVLDLQRQLAAETAAKEEALSKLEEAERVRVGALPPDVLAALPRCADLTLENTTGLARTAPGEGPPDALDVYARPLDGRRRFIQMVGRLTIEVTLLPTPGPAAPPPRRLAYTELTPIEVREAYRAGLFAAHYVVRVPLPELPDPVGGALVVRVQYLDALTGRVFDASRTIEPRSGALEASEKKID